MGSNPVVRSVSSAVFEKLKDMVDGSGSPIRKTRRCVRRAVSRVGRRSLLRVLPPTESSLCQGVGLGRVGGRVRFGRLCRVGVALWWVRE